MTRESKGDGQDGSLYFLHFVFRMLGIATPCRLNEGHGETERGFRPFSLENIIQIMLVSKGILPCHLGLPSTRSTGLFVVKVESMTVGDILQKLTNKKFKAVSYDLPPPMCE